MKRVRSLTELTPWLCMVSSGVVACKDGSLLASFEIEGLDGESLTQAEYEALLERASHAFAELSVDPWTITFTLKNTSDLEYPGLPMELEAAEHIDAVHRQRMQGAASIRPSAYLSLLLAPPRKDDRLFGNIGAMMATGASPLSALWFGMKTFFVPKHAFAYRAEEILIAVRNVDAVCERLMSVLSEWRLRRLYDEALIGFLRSTVSEHAPHLLPAAARGQWFLDSLLPDAELEVYPDHLRLGQRYVATLSIKDWPQASSADFVQAIMASGVASTLAVNFRLMSREQSKAEFAKLRSYAELTQFGIKDYIKAVFARAPEPDERRADPEKQAILQDVRDAYEAMAQGVVFGHMNVSLALYADSLEELNDAAQQILKVIHSVYPGAVRERLHALSAWAATLPGQIKEPVRWALMNTYNLVETAPILLPTRGQPRNLYFEEQTQRVCPALSVFPAAAGGHYYFNFHRGALGHTFVVGGSRSGKSVLMNFLISQFTKYMPCRVVIFDKDQSCRINTMMHGGIYFDPSLPPEEAERAGLRPVFLNPLSLIGDPTHWPWLVSWLSDLLSGKGYRLSTEDEIRLREAIEAMYHNQPRSHWRLSYLSTLLPSELRAELSPFIESGPYARYFDSEVDSFELGGITAFEMGEVLRNERIAPLFISYAFYRIQRLLEENRQPGKPVMPTFIYLEECWFLFENESFQERIRDWLKTLAKYGAFLVMATQSLEDMVSDNRKLFSSIRDNIATMIFAANPRAATKTLAELYKREFGVTDETIEMVASAVPRMEYVIVNDDHVKKIAVRFDERQLAYLRSDSKALSIFNDEISKGPGWQQRYLQRILENAT